MSWEHGARTLHDLIANISEGEACKCLEVSVGPVEFDALIEENP